MKISGYEIDMKKIKIKTIFHFVLNRYQISHVKDIVHELDPTAYITIYEVADIFRANQEQK